MVEFDEGEEVRLIKRSLDEFVEQEIRPLEEEHKELFTPDFRRLDDDGFLKDEAYDVIRTIRRKSGEAGFYGLHMPESVGGQGLSTVALAQTIQHLYTKGYGLNVYTIENAPGPHPTLLNLTDDLKERYLEPIVAGEMSACFALSESSSASDALNMETRAEQDGDEWVISGRKMWITNSPYADFGQVFAVTDPEVNGPARVSAFLFDTDNPGFIVGRPNETILNDGMQAEVEFDDMRVPAEHMIGEQGEGFYGAMSTINAGRVRIAARCAGLMEYLLEQTTEYANDRTSWGEPIGTRQHVRGKIAQIAVWQEVVENLTLKTAWLVDNGHNPIKEGAMAKYYGTELLFKAADNAVQVFGGNGLSHDYPIERIFRYARLMRIPEGTSEIQLERIADEVGLP